MKNIKIPFFKLHGLGNDFILVEQNKLFKDCNLKELAINLCNRHFGIGADGLLILSVSDKQAMLILSQKNENIYKVRIFNSDGSEAEICGNGIRCAALYIHKYFQPADKITIETLAGNIYPQVFEQDKNPPNPPLLKGGREFLIKVDIGEPRLKPSDIPVSGYKGKNVINQPLSIKNKKWFITTVSMGNPHCVIFVKNIDTIDLIKYGKMIEIDSHFPKKTNVEFVQVISRSYLKVKVWERGAGETLACGTGACSVVVAGVLQNLCNRETTVNLPGGDLEIYWSKDNNHVYLTGSAKEVFKGDFSYP